MGLIVGLFLVGPRESSGASEPVLTQLQPIVGGELRNAALPVLIPVWAVSICFLLVPDATGGDAERQELCFAESLDLGTMNNRDPNSGILLSLRK